MKPANVFTCYLCSRAGRQTLAPPAGTRSLICRDCNDTILHTGRAWCAYGRHVVTAEQRGTNGYCLACNVARVRTTRCPDGFCPATEVAARLYVDPWTIRCWLARGWPVDWQRVGSRLYLRDLATYPDAPPDRRVRANGTREWACENCGTTFASSQRARWCSHACRLRASRRNRRAA